ncbi:MAG: Rieske 2Fe-2S domain-containing protein [Deferrisomatales bacterium]
MSDATYPPDRPVDRREFLSTSAMAAGLVASLGTAAAYGVLYLVPARREGRTVEVLMAAVSELPEGAAKEFVDAQGRKALLVHHGKTIRAFSKMCPHLGCEVEWRPAEKQFFCPCHEGYFDAEGKNIAGPPPRPLDEFRVTVKDDNIFVALKEA